MPMKVREVIQLLQKHGWKEMRSKGIPAFQAHRAGALGRGAGNAGKELAPGTLNAILKWAGLK